MKHRRLVLLAALAAAAAYAVPAAAQQPGRDTPSTPAQGEEQIPDQDKDPLRGSTFIFDQSATTQTLRLDNGQQSFVPFYGWWMSLRPRWNFNDHLRVQARIDFYKEFTNSQDTTNLHEDVFGDIWTDLVYATPLSETGRWKNTKVSVGARLIWPTSKESQGSGTYVTAGALAGVSQKFPIRGEDAPALNSARAGLSFTYLHPFSRSTTADNYGNFAYTRMNTDERSFVSSQLTGQTLSEHTLYAIVDTGLQITPKLGFTLDWILINQWHYAPTPFCAPIAGNTCAPATNTQPDNQFVQLGWFLTSLDYEIIPEMSLGLGYYNLANTIGPNGQANNLFGSGENNFLWSPDARVFFDVTANLDKIFEDATGKYKPKPGQTAEAARAARTARIANGIR